MPWLAVDAEGSAEGHRAVSQVGESEVARRRRDVQQVVEIIQQIEKLSAVTRPEIKVYHLLHVDGSALSTLVNQIYTQILAARQGIVSITPLVKPNALLLVGRAESLLKSTREAAIIRG